MKLPNPKDYDFLWLAHGQTYLFLSIFLTEVYTSRDFLATVKNKKHRFYIGKQQRKQLQNLGLNFLQKKLPQYKRIVDNKIIAFKKLFKKVKESNLSKLTNKELADSFLKTVKLIRPIIREYFYTEYFLHDKAQKRIKENPDKNQELLKKSKRCKKLKFTCEILH